MSGKQEQDKPNVSRETPDDPVAMLNEILDRAAPSIPDPPEEKPSSKGPAEAEDVSRETPEPEEPTSPAGMNKRSSVYVYLAVLFGAAFLMLLLAYFVQQRNNDAVLDDLRMTNASREELLENIKALEEERDQLQKEVTYQKDRVAQKNEESSRAQESLEYTIRSLSDRSIQKQSLEYFWYLDQFMGNKEYTLASAVILFSADYYRSTWNSQVSVNPAQVERYEAYRQELIDRGCLQKLDHPRDGGTDIWFTDTWNPSQNEDVAALCILWLALDHHFVLGNDNGASQYLYLYPLGSPDTGYPDRVTRLASGFTFGQFQAMKDQLVEDKWIVVAEDGTIDEGPGPTGGKMDELYALPFELPLSVTSKIPIN